MGDDTNQISATLASLLPRIFMNDVAPSRWGHWPSSSAGFQSNGSHPHVAAGVPLQWFLESESRSVVSDSLRPHGLYSPWNSPGQNTGLGSCSLLQGIFPTQGLNPALPHCRWILHQLNPHVRPTILEWVAYPFSSGSFRPRDRTGVSCIAGGFFTNWASREARDSLGPLFYNSSHY